MGIFAYFRFTIGGFKPSDFLFPLVFLFLAFFPIGRKRMFALIAAFVMFAGLGAGLAHFGVVRFSSGKPSGEYTLMGTVEEISVQSGYSRAVLGNLYFDGESEGGYALVQIPAETLRTGDIILFTASCKRVNFEEVKGDSYAEYLFTEDIRFTANTGEFTLAGKSNNVFLRLNARLFDCLHENLSGDEANIAYALLTGNSGGMDGDLLTAVRKGGIAHIFAVSGLHIGILYAAVSLAFRFCRKYRVIPALAVTLCYVALCGFSVSSVRAFLMCAILGVYGAIGRKTDFLQSIGVAALAVLVYSPAQWLAVGFRLSFGACLGLALFSGTLTRALSKLPKLLEGYLAAMLSVQAFTLPVQLEAFGYVSVWGMLLNFFVIPALPVVFLSLIVCALCSLALPFAAGFFLALPSSLISVLLFLFSSVELTFVITGFTLGAGMSVYLVLCLFASERLRMRPAWRGIAASVALVLFCAIVVSENAVISGSKIVTYRNREGSAVLIRTGGECVLVIDGDITLKNCESFLSSNARSVDAVVVLASDEVRAINVAAFLSAEKIYARSEAETGLSETHITFAEAFSVGSLDFRYESEHKLALSTEGMLVEIDFEGKSALGADLFLSGERGGLIFFIRNAIISSS